MTAKEKIVRGLIASNTVKGHRRNRRAISLKRTFFWSFIPITSEKAGSQSQEQKPLFYMISTTEMHYKISLYKLSHCKDLHKKVLKEV